MNNNINRREFLKRLGLGSVAISGLSMAGCASKKVTYEAKGSETGPIPTDKMTYRTTPTSGDKVSLLGYGCMRWPTKNVNGEDVLDQDAINELVDTAMKHGVNYYDTSPVYCQGLSEHVTGIALSRHPRDSYYIATKLSNFAKETWSREASMAMYKNSLKELQTDYIDYLLLHSIGGGDDSIDMINKRFIENGMLDFLMAEREAGRVRNLGFSYHGDIKAFDYLLENHDKYKWDFVQIQLNYLDWQNAKKMNKRNTDAEYLYEELAKRNIPAVIMEPLLGGRLAKVPDHVLAMLKEREPEKSAASWAFRYAGTLPNVLTVLSGMTYMEHLKDNLRSYCPLKPLSEDEINMLYEAAGIIASYPTIACTDCKYCMPCPYGIDIPSIFIHYNKCVNEGNVSESDKDPNYAQARKAFLVGYDRSVPKLRQADHCTGCNQCTEHCPQRIRIPRELQRISEYVEHLKQNSWPEEEAQS